INEPSEGIHVIDNRNPKAPKPVKFINIPGNHELAINGSTLFADSYMDLLSFEISDLNNIQLIGRKEDLFSAYSGGGFYVNPEQGILTSWERKEKHIEIAACDVAIQPWGGFYYQDGIAVPLYAAEGFNSKAAVAPGTGSGPGLGGSLARMTINAGHLYFLDASYLKTIAIENPANPIPVDSLLLTWDIETIFPYKDKLFVGSQAGMHIVDVSTPTDPSLITTYAHIVSCDPVVVSDDYAYVTLRSSNAVAGGWGMPCTGFDDRLEIVDIRNLQAPSLLMSYPMTNPHGLGIDDTMLFVCDGNDGLKVYDVTDKLKLDKNMVAHYPFMKALDVIPYNNVVMMISEEGLYQYDYSNKKELKLLSHLRVTK